MDMFVSDDEVSRLENLLLTQSGDSRLHTLVELAWHLRQRDTGRAIQILNSITQSGTAAEIVEKPILYARSQLVRAEIKWLGGQILEALEMAESVLQQLKDSSAFDLIADTYWLLGAISKLQQAGIDRAQRRAAMLLELRAHTTIATWLPLLQHPEADLILSTAHQIGQVINNTSNINTAVAKVAKIVYALKSFARMDQQEKAVAARLQDGLDTVLTLYHNQIKNGIELVCDIDDLPTLMCQPDELNQVWTNLIYNALQAMHYEGKLTISLKRSSNEAVVSVSDTGGGIPEEIRSRIFDPFFTTKPSGEGSGLGLGIAQKIVAKHEGRIEVESQIGAGTTFRVILPFPGNGGSAGSAA